MAFTCLLVLLGLFISKQRIQTGHHQASFHIQMCAVDIPHLTSRQNMLHHAKVAQTLISTHRSCITSHLLLPPPPLPYKILFAIHFIKNFRGSLYCHLKYEALKPISHTTSCHLSWWVHYFLNIDSCYFCLYKTCGSYKSHIHVLPFNCSLCTHCVKPCFVEYNVARTQNKNQRLCLMYKYNNIKCI